MSNFKFQISNWNLAILTAIILLAAALRFYKLGINPPGLYWDEAVFGYDAYSILITGQDQHGVTLPLFFESFGDWKLPGYHYLLVPSIAIFGLNEFAVRFPSALLGTLTVLLTYLLVKELFRLSDENQSVNQSIGHTSGVNMVTTSRTPGVSKVTDKQKTGKPKSENRQQKTDNSSIEAIALLSAFFLAISPWHIQFSRGGFESTAGLFFVVSGTYLFLWGFGKKNTTLLTFAFILLTLSMYTYHAYRIFTPLLAISIIFIFYQESRKILTKLIIPAILSLILLLPLIIFTVSPQGKARAVSQSVFSQETYESTRIYYDQNSKPPLRFLAKYWSSSLYNSYLAFNNYLDHFSPTFLFYQGDQIGRHSQVDMGQIYLFDGILLLASLFALKKLNKRFPKVIMLSWLILSPIPATIVTPAPHAYRTLQMSVPLAFFSALGAYFIFCTGVFAD